MITGRIHDGEFFPPSADGPRRSTLPSRGGSFICRCLHEAVLVVRSRYPAVGSGTPPPGGRSDIEAPCVDTRRRSWAAPTALEKTSGSQPDLAEQLERLASLADSGALSEEEFNAAKSRILSAQGDADLERPNSSDD